MVECYQLDARIGNHTPGRQVNPHLLKPPKPLLGSSRLYSIEMQVVHRSLYTSAGQHQKWTSFPDKIGFPPLQHQYYETDQNLDTTLNKLRIGVNDLGKVTSNIN